MTDTSQHPNHKNGKFDWRVVGVTVALIFGQGLIQWGITSATMTEHSRRLELVEKRMDERSLPREEFEKRHEELSRRVDENRRAIDNLRRRNGNKIQDNE